MHRFLVPLVAAVLLLAAPAGAAVRCPVPAPGSPLPRASSAQAGLDQAQLDLAVHAIQDRRSYAIRVLRHGCLVGEDTHANEYRDQLWEGHGLTSAVVGLLAGRAMELGRLDPDDPVGALVPEAGRELGGATVADLLARASGLRPEPEDRSVPDPLRLALATPVVAPPGSRFGDAPTALAVLGEVVARAAGRDLVAFAGAELFGPLGIRAFGWERDARGRPRTTFGLKLTADDAARIGELLRREGVWGARRLLPAAFVERATRPGADEPCAGWLVWLNARRGCRGSRDRLLPGLPADLVQLRGRDDQRIMVFPALGLTVVRYGLAGGDLRAPDDQETWERGVLLMLMGAVQDEAPALTDFGDGRSPATDDPLGDRVRLLPDAEPPLPAPGPRRARAVAVSEADRVAGRDRRVAVRIACPVGARRACEGTAALPGRPAVRWRAAPGSTTRAVLRLARRPRHAQTRVVTVVAEDEAGGLRRTLALRVLP